MQVTTRIAFKEFLKEITLQRSFPVIKNFLWRLSFKNMWNLRVGRIKKCLGTLNNSKQAQNKGAVS